MAVPELPREGSRRSADARVEEATGLAAVDDVLARMRLRARDGVVRTMPERLAGCRRLLWLQRISLAIGVMLYAVLLLDALVGT